MEKAKYIAGDRDSVLEDETKRLPELDSHMPTEEKLLMPIEEFTQRLKCIMPDGDSEISTWVTWAKELEQMDSSDYELPKGSYKTQEEFLHDLYKRIKKICKSYGQEVAVKVISMAGISFCLFPWELKQAAIHLSNGSDLQEIQRLSEEGLLEDFSDAK